MNFPEIKVYLLARSVPDRSEIQRWVRDFGGSAAGHHVPGVEEATDAEICVAYPAKRCYKSFEPGLNPNVSRVRKDMAAFLDNILASEHGSVLEHATWTFAFENVTRVFTGEMNRHRAGVAISEGSMRYIRFDDIPFWMPLSVRSFSDDVRIDTEERNGQSCLSMTLEQLRAHEIDEERREETRDVISSHLKNTEWAYKELCRIWDIESPDTSFTTKKYLTSMFRRIIPMGVCTGGTWTMNCRAMRHIITMRTSSAAEEEIAFVFSQVAQLMVEAEPRLFGDFTTADGTWTPKYRKV